MQRDLEAKTSQIAQFGAVGESLRTQMEARDRLEQQAAALRAEVAEKSQKVQNLEEECESARQQHEIQCLQLSATIQQLKSALDAANERTSAQKSKFEQEIAELHKKLASAQNAFEDGVHCMLDQATGDAERLQRLESENQSLRLAVADKTESAARISRQSAQIQTLDSRLFALASENSDLRKQQEELVGTRAQLREAQARLGSVYAGQIDVEAQVELSELRQQLNERVQREAVQADLLENCKNELRRAQKQVKALQKQINA